MSDHIVIGDTRPRVQYLGDGSQTAFPFLFPIFTEADLQVWLDDTLATSGFTISGAGTSGGGTVSFGTAPALGMRVTLVRSLDIARETDFAPGGPLRASTLNDALDRLTAVCQQLDDRVRRTVRLGPAAPEDATLTLPTPQPGALLGWNATATGLDNDPVDVAGVLVAIRAAHDDTTAALAALPAAVAAADTAAVAAGRAGTWADDAATAAWLVRLSETNAQAALAELRASTDAVRRWAEDAALSAWLAGLEPDAAAAARDAAADIQSTVQALYDAVLAVAGSAAGIGDGALDVPRQGALGSAASVDVAQIVGLFEVTHGADVTLTAWPLRRCERATAAVTLTLPAAADCPPGWHRHISARGGAVTLAAAGSDTVNGAASLSLSAGATALIVRTGCASFERYAT